MEYSQTGEIAVLKFDDGKANAVGFDFQANMHEGLDRAEKDAKAVVIAGRENRFSAGFDLSVMSEGPEAAGKMVLGGARMLHRLFTFKLPVVAACTGHAIAAGGFMLLACDTRIGAAGDYKIGLNETAIGMTLPVFGFQLAKSRLAPTYFTSAVVQANIFDPDGAREAGFLDQTTTPDNVIPAAIDVAQRLSALPADAYYGNKMGMRETAAETIRKSFESGIP
jgi:enoyl-CoA hydratase